VHNVVGGVIEGSRDMGQTWQLIGHVLQPTTKVNPRGFTAAKYGPVGTTVATAVNALHLKAGQNTAEKRGIIWSLSPKAETEAGRVSLQSEVSPGSSAYTDIPGGSGIFGGPFTPFVGNPIFLDNDRNNQLSPLPDGYVPALGDSWLIRIERPLRYPSEIDFENHVGGSITIRYRGEAPRAVGQVLQPVQGIGRFVGSYFSDMGRLRANHNGVIDVSTSPRGKIGSFQIIPANHAHAPELSYVLKSPQWMIVGPLPGFESALEGTAPLYSGFLRPRFDRRDLWNEDPVEGLAGRFVFEVKVRGSDDWQRMPIWWMEQGAPLAPYAATALANVTHLRILFPFTWDEPGQALSPPTIPAPVEPAATPPVTGEGDPSPREADPATNDQTTKESHEQLAPPPAQ